MRVSTILLTISLATLAGCASQVGSVNGGSSVITVPDDYLTISEAISHANIGDMVFVREGTYEGPVIVDKPLVLKGENSESTVLRLDPADPPSAAIGMWILASGVTVQGFRMVPNAPDTLVCLVLIDGRNAYLSNNIFKDNILEGNGSDAFGAFGLSRSRIFSNMIICSPGQGACLSLADHCSSNIVCWNTMIGGCMGFFVGFGGNGNSFFGNTVMNQTLSEGWGAGAMIMNSLDTLIYHNCFINNERQAMTWSCNSSWDNGYPSGGNYWGDYDGADLCQGPFQNVTGSDGIGDEAYIVPRSYEMDIVNKDHYPLMSPPPNRDPADVNCDGKIDIADVAMTSATFGSHRGVPRFDPLCDLNGDDRIDIIDLAIVSAHFGRYY